MRLSADSVQRTQEKRGRKEEASSVVADKKNSSIVGIRINDALELFTI